VALGDLQGREIEFRPGGAGMWGEGGGSRFDGQVGGESDLIVSRVRRLRFRYHGGRSWRSSFDTLGEGRLPAAVEVAIWFDTRSPEVIRREQIEAQRTLGGGGSLDGVGMAGDERANGRMGEMENEGKPEGPPDRLRVIIVPDGPEAGYAQGGA